MEEDTQPHLTITTSAQSWLAKTALALRFTERVPPDLRQEIIEEAHQILGKTKTDPTKILGSPTDYAARIAKERMPNRNRFGPDLDGYYPFGLAKAGATCASGIFLTALTYLLITWLTTGSTHIGGNILALAVCALLFLVGVQMDRLATLDALPVMRIGGWLMAGGAIIGFLALHAAKALHPLSIPTKFAFPAFLIGAALTAVLAWKLPYWAPRTGGKEISAAQWYRRLALTMHARYGLTKVEAATVAANARTLALDCGKHPADLLGDVPHCAQKLGSKHLINPHDTDGGKL